MGCASAKHVSTVQNEEDAQNGKSYQNGDAFCDEYRIKPVEEVKYMKNGEEEEEEEQKIVSKNQENLEKSATHQVHPVHPKSNNEAPVSGPPHRINIHISESQQEFFRMLDEKIEKVTVYERITELHSNKPHSNVQCV
uniref:Chromosome 1 open reading frame 21 n=1 Tax=Leptobrachium leishanense TaxID=445787 RepID=A0A8C5MM92_9ANUR